MPGLPLVDFPWWQIWAINFALMLLRYLVFAGGAFVVFYLIGRARFAYRRIQPKLPKRADYLREVGYSLSTFCIFGFVALGVVYARNNGQTLIYDRIADYGWGWFALSVGLMILLHDTYFYWTHRLMHWRPLFKHVHLVHHLSTNPSPWASFAFHPFEAVVEAGILPLIVVLIPAHPLALLLFLIYMTGMNVLGHLGYEFYPRWFLRNSLTNWNNTSTHHALHHQFFTGNYGLYFNWWDRWMGTNQARYVATFERVAAQARTDTNPAPIEATHQTA